jgi:molybdopterin/thiamine biosynthesis adenylyltransferase/rhodanese-related sulfurtransferase
MLTAGELARYARQLALPEVGLAGQERLQNAKVVIVGAGGLGSPAALYLAAAGVGVIGLVDDDAVEISNLHRQVLHRTADIGRDKPASAAQTLAQLNPHVRVQEYPERLTVARAETLFREYDVVVDGSDNYATRYAINDACAKLGKVWVYGSVERFSGQVSVFGTPGGPCYRCLFPDAPSPGTTASCEEIGVLGAVPGVIGSLQAVETLKCILAVGELLAGRLLQLDLRNASTRIIEFTRNPDCLACSDSVRPREQAMPREEASPIELLTPDIEPDDLARRLDDPSSFHLLDVREPWEWALAQIGKPRLLAMNQLPGALDSLDRSRELIVYCHHGVRSGMAAEWLRAQGFRARNLSGGIDRWSREIDPSVPRY